MASDDDVGPVAWEHSAALPCAVVGRLCSKPGSETDTVMFRVTDKKKNQKKIRVTVTITYLCMCNTVTVTVTVRVL